ncbi:MAG: MerR family transcriptional regulator [Oscillospiraceae bacterium]|nr:MerR family transcriptional regulator [Oscillospiraceae bacterium]MBR3952464.1 MerR family transcriptional regulator [Oscillospiraceae bacterium]
MKSELLSIGEMAKINNISVSTLRLYDEIGLIKPCYIDGESRYRYYNIRQNARLDMIQYMKALGMELKEIKEVLESGDTKLIESILIRRKKQVKEQMANLNLQLAAISRTIESLERYRKSPSIGMITIEYIPHRKIYSVPTSMNFYDYGIEVYENELKKLKNSLIKHNLPQIYYCNAGTTMKKESFLEGRLESDEIFVLVDDEFPQGENIKRIESGMYVCIYLDSFDEEAEYAKRLLEYCEENNYKVAGDYICEVLTEFSVFDDEKRGMFLRLQVPVAFR